MGTKLIALRFKAESLRVYSLVLGSPAGCLILEMLTDGIKADGYLTIKLVIMVASISSCILLLMRSHSIMEYIEEMEK